MNGKFSFDSVEDFDTHIDNSIPGYTLLSEAVHSIAMSFLPIRGKLIDLGSSTGKILEQFKERMPDIEVIGYEISENMITQAPYFTEEKDITKEPIEKADCFLSLFTLQFLRYSERAQVIQRVFNNLPKGGAFILAEKVSAKTGFEQEIQTFSFYDFKQRTFSASEILGKQQDLRRLMNLVEKETLLQEMQEAGFKTFEFFRMFNFIGIVGVK